MSYEINLQIGVKASPETVYQTLTDTKQLAKWWTTDTRGSGAQVGDTLEFWFGPFSEKFEVKALQPAKQVTWKAPKGQGADEWQGTEVAFDLSKDDRQTFIHFRHSGWKDASEFHAHCSMKWATFMLSLKDLLERGKGRPAPHDLDINYR